MIARASGKNPEALFPIVKNNLKKFEKRLDKWNKRVLTNTYVYVIRRYIDVVVMGDRYTIYSTRHLKVF